MLRDCIPFVFELCTGLLLELQTAAEQSGLSLPMLVPQGYSALFVSILSAESKGLITVMKARGTAVKASDLISIYDCIGTDHLIYYLLTLSDLLCLLLVTLTTAILRQQNYMIPRLFHSNQIQFIKFSLSMFRPQYCGLHQDTSSSNSEYTKMQKWLR